MREIKPWLDANQIHALFNQRKYWIDKERTTHEIRHMSDRHLTFTHRYLRRNYRRWYWGTLRAVGIHAFEEAWFGAENVDHDAPKPLPPHVKRTPLYKALDHEMKRRGLERLPT